MTFLHLALFLIIYLYIDFNIFNQTFFEKRSCYKTCPPSTISDLQRQADDKARIEAHQKLSERFLPPIELLTRYKTFHENCEALVKPDTNEREVHAQRAREFREALEVIRVMQLAGNL